MYVTIVIDNFTIMASAIVLAVAVGTCFLNPFIRFRKKQGLTSSGEEGEGKALPAPELSVVLSPHDELERLRRNLPAILKQDYPSGFQVIVVIDESAHETEDFLKRMQAELKEKPGDGELYYTYIPDSSRYVSRKKLAITVGVKAAKSEWVLITEAFSTPSSSNWLATMAKGCTADNHVVIGYGNYADEASSFKRFERLYNAHYLMREDVKGEAYGTLSHNVMFRKSDFLREDGFLGSLNLIRGEYDFIVNKYAAGQGTALVTDDEAWVIDEAPSRKTWLASHIFFVETRKWLGGGKAIRWLYGLDTAALHVSLLMTLGALAYAAYAVNVLLACAGVAALTAMVTIRTVIGMKVAGAFHEKVPLMLVYPYQVSLLWHNIGYRLRHHFSDKLDFTTHKQ